MTSDRKSSTFYNHNPLESSIEKMRESFETHEHKQIINDLTNSDIPSDIHADANMTSQTNDLAEAIEILGSNEKSGPHNYSPKLDRIEEEIVEQKKMEILSMQKDDSDYESP